VTIATRPRSSLRFRGRSFLAIVLTPEMPVEGWLAEVDAWLARTPGFLAGKPLVVDVTGLPLGKDEFRSLMAELKTRRRLDPRRGGRQSVLARRRVPAAADRRADGGGCRCSRFHTSPRHRHPPTATAPCARAAARACRSQVALALMVESSVRSGQAIVHPDGDVTVIGSVASGAEIVAGGSIHIYGTLRGRALAGMYGNGRARIFCRRLEAELIAIDGFYKVADELEAHLHRKAVQAWLEGGTVKIMTLD
jgi:septum site-determining protein MinC